MWGSIVLQMGEGSGFIWRHNHGPLPQGVSRAGLPLVANDIWPHTFMSWLYKPGDIVTCFYKQLWDDHLAFREIGEHVFQLQFPAANFLWQPQERKLLNPKHEEVDAKQVLIGLFYLQIVIKHKRREWKSINKHIHIINPQRNHWNYSLQTIWQI